MTIRFVAMACLGLVGACASGGGTAIDTGGSQRFRDLATVVMSESGEGLPMPGMGYIRYPDEERRRNVEASFAFAFLLDATGHVEYETISFLNGAPPAFFDEACLWLRSMRFVPVQRDGTPQRALVVSDLTFTLDVSRGPGSGLSVKRATRVNAERYRRELAALGVARSVQKLEAHRHCP